MAAGGVGVNKLKVDNPRLHPSASPPASQRGKYLGRRKQRLSTWILMSQVWQEPAVLGGNVKPSLSHSKSTAHNSLKFGTSRLTACRSTS